MSFAARPRLLKYLDHRTFPQVVGELIRNHPDLQHCAYTQDFPEDAKVTDLPRIVWTLKSRTPGKMGLEPYKARLRPQSTWRNEDGTVAKLFGQYQTCLWQFDVCSRSSAEADDLAFKLEEMLLDSIPLFRSLGGDDLIFDEQLEDALLPRTKDIVVRSLRFRAFLERVHIQTYDALQEIRIRTFLPQDAGWEPVVRGATSPKDDPYLDILEQTHISYVHAVADDQSTGIARPSDPLEYGVITDHRDPTEYVPGTDYEVIYDPKTAQSAILWLGPGKKPAPGATYYVRYTYWTGFSTLYLPS